MDSDRKIWRSCGRKGRYIRALLHDSAEADVNPDNSIVMEDGSGNMKDQPMNF